MKVNKLIIEIKKPTNVVFNYYTNPKNTPLWWDVVNTEETNDWPIKIGTTYRSQSKESGQWNEFTVTDFRENEIFELTSKDDNYHVRYTQKPIDEKSTELEYYEWVNNGELEDPFTMETLNILKSVIERL